MTKACANMSRKFCTLTLALLVTAGGLPAIPVQAASDTIANNSLRVQIGDLGQISSMNIINDRKSINYVLPNDTANQNNTNHQWMGEMIFSYRTGDSANFPNNSTGFVEVDTNKTLAAGGSTTASNIKADNPYIKKTKVSDKRVEVDFIGQSEGSTTSRTMKGFDVKSVFDTETDDGSMLWSVTLSNKGSKYIEFGDVGLPMPWNNKYASLSDTYNNRLTVHTFAGADSGYAYAIRTSGEGNYMLFTPVPDSGARIEYVDTWLIGERASNISSNWCGDQGGWYPGLSVYYIHSKNIRNNGRSYFPDYTSLVLAPGESKTYQFKFSAIRAGDNTPQSSASDHNNASNSVEEREANLHSVLYQSGMVDAIAVPSFQTAINMPAKVALHYDDTLVHDVNVQIQNVQENDPFGPANTPVQNSLVNSSRTGRGLPAGNPGYEKSCRYLETKVVNGEQYHIYELNFDCVGNNSVRVDYQLGDEQKFTQFEFNILAEIDQTVDTHADFMVQKQQENDPSSPLYGIYYDWYLSGGKDTNMNHWGDDWSHDNINFMTMKNFLRPDPEEVESIERYLIDFMWESYMKNTHSNYQVANYLSASGVYTTSTNPYSRTYSEMMEATGFFNMYRIQKAYPNLIAYRETPQYYLEKAYGIYYNRIGSGSVGFYGEQQVPDMIEALRAEGMTTQANNLQNKFAYTKGRTMANATYPYGSEFEYDNTGEEGAYAASKALRTYYPDDARAATAKTKMEMAEWKTRAMRGIQPVWYYYADPVFRGGEHWWNFQYTASLAGSIIDDWLRFQDNGWDPDSRAWGQRVNYGAKLSNFNAVNMGQISAQSVGSTSWRYTQYKGSAGTKDVNDGGSRVMNNGWNDFSGESDEGLYGSLLRISSDVVTDPVFGLFGYGCTVSKSGGVYTVKPLDGVGKRMNLLDEKYYFDLVQDQCTQAVIEANGASFEFALKNLTGDTHLSQINLSGAGLQNGFYSVKLNGQAVGQCYVRNNKGTAGVMLPQAATATVTLEQMSGGENQAPSAFVQVASAKAPQVLIPFTLNGAALDDGAPNGELTYLWEVVSKPEGGELTLTSNKASVTKATGTKTGNYVVKLTVSDGVLTGSTEKTIMLDPPPSKQPPVIGDLTAKQGSINTSVVTLTGTATPDPTYNGTLTYQWSIVSKPDGADAVLGNAAKETALLKVNKAGSYTLRFEAIDGEISAQKEITFEARGDIDGIQRAVSVVTQKGSAPVLPATMDVIYSDGTVGSGNAVWNQIDPSQYDKAGAFAVEGVIAGTGLQVAVNVHVVTGTAANVALAATPTAIINSVSDLGGVTKMNDGIDPKSSSETANGAWHNWLGNQGGSAWVQYSWDQAILATSMDVYVFRDGSGNFQPKDMKVTLCDENGNWYTPRAVSGLGNTLNQYNRTTFEPAYITGIRIDMNPVTLGCGILEWKVYGYASNLVDKSALRNLVAATDALRAAQFVGGLTPITEAKAAANAVINNAKATQEEVDAALRNLTAAMANLVPLKGNLAYAGMLSASFTSSWESLPSVNDGSQLSGSHWGTWGNTSGSEWIQYSWPWGVDIELSDLFVWNDGGGIGTPTKYVYSYLPMDSDTWVTLKTVTSGITANASNKTTLDDPVTVRALRCTITKPANDSNGIGLWEWEVYGPADKTALKDLIAQAKDLDETRYTQASWAVLSQALTNANAVVANGEATQQAIDSAAAALREALDALAQAADKTVLQALIAQAQALDETAYTPMTWAVLAQALSAANDALADGEATQQVIDSAAAALQAALDALAQAADKTALQALIAQVEDLDEALYTTETWEPFAQALSETKDVLLDGEAAQEEVDDAFEELTEAFDNLLLLSDVIHVESLKIDSPSLITLKRGTSIQLTAIITPLDATYQDLTWKSLSPNVVSVDEDGKVTASSKTGTVIVQVTARNGVTAQITIRVTV